jgi:non-ribosomal peptide synthetase component F
VAHKVVRQYDAGGSHWQLAALLFGHGIEMIIGLIGVLKSGRTYVPLDPVYPPERLKYMLKDSRVRLIITDRSHYSLAEALRNKADKNIKILIIDEIDETDKKRGGER